MEKKTIYKKEKTVKKLELISVFRRIILGRHHQTPSFSGSSIHRFYNVNHLLFVLHGPVDLVVVSGSQINHDVFVSGKQERRKRWSSAVRSRLPVTRIPHLKKNMTVHGSYNSYILLKSGTSVMSTR